MKKGSRGELTQVSRAALSVSLTAFCVLLVFTAFFCASSAKGTLAQQNGAFPSRPPSVAPPAVTDPAGAEASGLPKPPESSVSIAGESSSGAESMPPTAEENTFRALYADEHVIGAYRQNGVDLRISKVERGELHLFVCEFYLDSPQLLRTAFAGGRITGRQYTSEIAQSVGAAFAVNGDFCGYRSNGIIIRNGTVIRDRGADWDLLYLDKNGDLQTGISDDFQADALVADGALQSWCFGPTLVKDFRKIEEMNRPGLSSWAREPRTAIGQVDELHYILLVADAVRTDDGTVGGLTFSELADEFVALGCKTAYNLDGGGSTTLYFNGEVINRPCVNGERRVSDIIYLQ